MFSIQTKLNHLFFSFIYLMLFISFALGEEPRAINRFQLSFISALRSNAIFRGSDNTKTGNLQALSGKIVGNSSKSSHFFPYGIEFESKSFVNWGIRIVPLQLRLKTDGEEQFGLDSFLCGTIGSYFPLGENRTGNIEFGLRFRRWFMNDGAIPSTGHLGFILMGELETGPWKALFEAGLMATGIGNPAAVGLQRDASSLRFRMTRAFTLHESVLAPFIEFFHTHRNFYGSKLIAEETALFFDEASLLLGLGFVF